MPSCTTASLRFLSRCLKTGPLPSGGAGFLCPERCRDNAYLSGQKAFSGMMQGRTALCCGLPRQLLGLAGLPLLPTAPGHRELSAWLPSYHWACCGLPRQLLGLAELPLPPVPLEHRERVGKNKAEVLFPLRQMGKCLFYSTEKGGKCVNFFAVLVGMS